MIVFTVLGFVIEGGKYLSYHLDIFADTPMDAMEKVRCGRSNLVVSSVQRAHHQRPTDY